MPKSAQSTDAPITMTDIRAAIDRYREAIRAQDSDAWMKLDQPMPESVARHELDTLISDALLRRYQDGLMFAFGKIEQSSGK